MRTRWRGLAVVLLLLAGVLAGYAASLALARQPAEAGTPAPVVALSPSIPVDPPPSITADPRIAPLSTDLELRRTTFRDVGFAFSYPRPRGWSATRVDQDEKWRDPQVKEDYTYILRVRNTRGEYDSIERTLTDRVRDLETDQQHVEWLERTDDLLAFSYVVDGHRRFGLLQWVDLSGSGFAEVEVAVTGREVDQEGMRALLDAVVGGLQLA